MVSCRPDTLTSNTHPPCRRRAFSFNPTELLPPRSRFKLRSFLLTFFSPQVADSSKNSFSAARTFVFSRRSDPNLTSYVVSPFTLDDDRATTRRHGDKPPGMAERLI
jgi:hypothetical protein